MKKVWLIGFNLITLLAWTCFFLHALLHGLTFGPQSLLLLNVAQGLAVFEILNAVIGIAGANWLLTTMQVSSRLIVLGLLNWIPEEQMAEAGMCSGFAVVAIAWSITETVRALYYLTGLSGRTSFPIAWMRYTFFIALYPMGVIGEFMVMYGFWKWREFGIDAVNLSLLAVALLYFVFFPRLYGHIFKQRKRKLA